MKKTTSKLFDPRRGWRKPRFLPQTIRHMVFSLAVPALFGGCAHQGRVDPPIRDAAKLGEIKRVFHIGPSRRGGPVTDTYAATLPELSSAFSTAAIIENILSRKRQAAHSGTGPLRFPKSSAPPSSQPQAPAGAMAKAPGGVKIIASTAAPRKGHKATSRDAWDSVRGNLVLAGVEHEAVATQLEALRGHPGAVDFLMKRAEPYLQYLLEEIDRQGLPHDMILVPMVESAFETGALSPKQAAGIWQFIPSTGAQYGLTITEGYDGRYDIHAATRAALKYLKHLNGLFGGDWLLALAAYNAGEGAVGRAIESNRKAGGTGTFWELDLPAETEAYVLKILTLAHAVGNPEAHGFKTRKAGPQAYLARVEIGPEVKIAEVAAAAGMAPEEFYRLNPAFKPEAPPPPQTYHLLMPKEKAEALAGNLAGTKVFAMRTVVVKKGETLSILAKRHGVPELKLAEWNGLNPKTPLKAGQELVVFPV